MSYEFAVEMTFPLPEGTSAGLINLSGMVCDIAVYHCCARTVAIAVAVAVSVMVASTINWFFVHCISCSHNTKYHISAIKRCGFLSRT